MRPVKGQNGYEGDRAVREVVVPDTDARIESRLSVAWKVAGAAASIVILAAGVLWTLFWVTKADAAVTTDLKLATIEVRLTGHDKDIQRIEGSIGKIDAKLDAIGEKLYEAAPRWKAAVEERER